MDSFLVGASVFFCLLGGALLGRRLRAVLPEDHTSQDSKDVVKLAMGLVATMAALVLGLVTASAKSSYDLMDTAVKDASTQVLSLDRLLAQYGPETQDIRGLLRAALEGRVNTIWPEDARPERIVVTPEQVSKTDEIESRILSLTPRTDAQRWLQTRALELTTPLLRTRWLAGGAAESPVPRPFLVILTSWLTILFASFGLLAPRNTTVAAALFLCALSVSSAVFLILQMGRPFSGLMKVSDAPLRFALSRLGQ